MAYKVKQEEVAGFEQWFAENNKAYDFNNAWMEMHVVFNPTDAYATWMSGQILFGEAPAGEAAAGEAAAGEALTVGEEYRITTRNFKVGKQLILDCLHKLPCDVYPSKSITVTIYSNGAFCDAIELDLEKIDA